jgi:hypothetical protein
MSLIDRINANPLPFAQLLGIEFISAEAEGEDENLGRFPYRGGRSSLRRAEVGHRPTARKQEHNILAILSANPTTLIQAFAP